MDRSVTFDDTSSSWSMAGRIWLERVTWLVLFSMSSRTASMYTRCKGVGCLNFYEGRESVFLNKAEGTFEREIEIEDGKAGKKWSERAEEKDARQRKVCSNDVRGTLPESSRRCRQL